MEIVEVKPGLFACLTANETSNAGFVVTDRGVIVIDTLSTPALGRELGTAIKTQTGKPVLLVINTHHHHDHVFGNQAFDAPVVAHCALAGQLAQATAESLESSAVAEWVAEHPEDRWLADELELVYPNIIFEQRLLLDLAPVQMVVRHMGGHTPDSTIVDIPEMGLVFAGDLVFEGRVPYLGDANIADTIRALEAVEALGDRIVMPGHGSLCDLGYVSRCREYLSDLQTQVGTLISQGRQKAKVLRADELPRWWTDDRPELQRANLERVYDQLSASAVLA
jgi:glyoxylase-like metal-dependent hydrolase (beta-lactamase superfamily II)